jgi:antitoxin YefM
MLGVFVMQTVSYKEACDHLSSLMDSATRDREPIAITRNGAGTVVLLAAEEFAAMEETLHLLSTPANAERLRESLADYKAGKLQSGELCD